MVLKSIFSYRSSFFNYCHDYDPSSNESAPDKWALLLSIDVNCGVVLLFVLKQDNLTYLVLRWEMIYNSMST